MIDLHTAYDCLCFGLYPMFFINRIHDFVPQLVGDDDCYDLLFRLQGDTVIFFQCSSPAPSGAQNGASACPKASGGVKDGFRIALIDADQDQAVFVF